LQGRVDEFTKKTPHKRKEILAEILESVAYMINSPTWPKIVIKLLKFGSKRLKSRSN
jgi:hypothetical protein